jgi:hypothetical protein
VRPTGIGGLEIIGKLDGAVAAGVGEVGQHQGGDGDEKAGEMWFHAGLLDITIGKETAWARSGPASAAAKLALTMCRSAFSEKISISK